MDVLRYSDTPTVQYSELAHSRAITWRRRTGQSVMSLPVLFSSDINSAKIIAAANGTYICYTAKPLLRFDGIVNLNVDWA